MGIMESNALADTGTYSQVQKRAGSGVESGASCCKLTD